MYIQWKICCRYVHLFTQFIALNRVFYENLSSLLLIRNIGNVIRAIIYIPLQQHKHWIKHCRHRKQELLQHHKDEKQLILFLICISPCEDHYAPISQRMDLLHLLNLSRLLTMAGFRIFCRKSCKYITLVFVKEHWTTLITNKTWIFAKLFALNTLPKTKGRWTYSNVGKQSNKWVSVETHYTCSRDLCRLVSPNATGSLLWSLTFTIPKTRYLCVKV